jgi:hypothetical protein
MRPFAILSASLTLALVGCAAEPTPTAPRNAPRLAGAAVPTARPLSGGCETSFTPPPFPLPPVFRQVDTGTCQLAHLGRVQIYSVQDIDFATGTQVSVELTFTAANGDVLRATNVGSSVPSAAGVAFQGTMTFIGGTGRFANATGAARVEGTADLMASTAAFTVVDGWIAYDASARRGQP